MTTKSRVLLLAGCLLSSMVGGAAISFLLRHERPAQAASGSQEVQELLKAKKVAIYDEQGRPRAALGMSDDQPMIAMMDADGKPRISLGIGSKGPGISITDPNRREVLVLTAKDDGVLGLVLVNKDGKAVGALMIEKDGKSYLQVTKVIEGR